jgi:ABC transport system ATP-binding/permease protein
VQAPDIGDVTRRRELVVSYLPQDFMLDATKSVAENIRDGAKPVLDLIAEFESLAARLETSRGTGASHPTLEGWTLDQRIETAMSHLNCPAGDRRMETLSGGEKRRVAMCRAIVSLPDFLILDEPTNHLDPESIDWVADFLEEFHGSFLVVTHDRYFLDRVAKRMVELYDGKFWSHDGNYTDYLLAKAERQEADATIEHKRQMFLKKELAWVRQGPRAQRSKQKDRFERYYDEAAKDGPRWRKTWNWSFRRRRNSGNRTVEVSNLGMELGGRRPCSPDSISPLRTASASASRAKRPGQNHAAENHHRPARADRWHGEDRPAHKVQLRGSGAAAVERRTQRAGRSVRRHGVCHLGRRQNFGALVSEALSLRGRPHHHAGQETQRRRTQPVAAGAILKCGGNFLILDEPTNDLDLPTLRVLEEALIAFPGVVCVSAMTVIF